MIFYTTTHSTKRKSLKKSLTILFFLFGFFIYAEDFHFKIDSRISEENNLTSDMEYSTFIQTALVASGTTDVEIEKLLISLDKVYKELEDTFIKKNTSSNLEKAEYTLLFLYENIFFQYSLLQTQVDVTLNKGVYNCVSSSIIYMYFMKRLNIPVIAIETPVHAFCAVKINDQLIDVETTNPYGFNPGEKKDISINQNQKKYAIVPAKDYKGRHNVDDKRIIALIYNNRISNLQKQNKNRDTITLACSAYFLQNKSDESLSILNKCVYNTAINLAENGKEEEGINLIIEAKSLFGESENSSLYSTAIETSAINLINKTSTVENYDLALQILDKYKNYISENNRNQLNNMIIFNSLNKKIKSETFEDALNNLQENKIFLSSSNYEKLFIFLYSSNADKIAKNGDYQKAWLLLDEGLSIYKQNPELAKQRNIYRNNYAINIHNQCVKLINENNISSAKNLLQEGLNIVTESTLLKNDLKKLE